MCHNSGMKVKKKKINLQDRKISLAGPFAWFVVWYALTGMFEVWYPGKPGCLVWLRLV